MAGSYGHAIVGWSLIENMGDAYETVEELLWLVQENIGEDQARELLQSLYYPMARGELEPSESYKQVKELMGK